MTYVNKQIIIPSIIQNASVFEMFNLARLQIYIYFFDC